MNTEPATPRPTEVTRNLSLVGPEAEAWFQARGLQPSMEGGLAVYSDAIVTPGLGMARLYHTATHLAHALPSVRDSVTLLVVLEGSVELTVAGAAQGIGVGEMVILSSRFEYSLTSTASGARMEIDLPHSFFDDYRLPRLRLLHRVAETTGMTKVLVAMINSTLGSADIHPDRTGWSGLVDGTTAMCAGLLRDGWGTILSTGSSAETTVYLDALDRIEMHAKDPDFDAGALAAALNISGRTLRRAFLSAETTASAEIRATRVRIALRRLAGRRVTNDLELRAIATASGFRTVKTMNESIRQQRRGDAGDLDLADDSL